MLIKAWPLLKSHFNSSHLLRHRKPKATDLASQVHLFREEEIVSAFLKVEKLQQEFHLAKRCNNIKPVRIINSHQ